MKTRYEARRRDRRGFAWRSWKARPAVIIQIDVLNENLRTVLLCPISSFSSQPTFFRVPVKPTMENGLRLPSEIMVDKLQAANKSKVGQVIGHLDQLTMRRLADRSE